MVRLKFLLFALLVLGLGLLHFPLVSGPLSAHAEEGANAQAASAIADVARALDARRGVVQGVALKLAASRELAQALQPLLAPVQAATPGRRPVRAPRGQPVQPVERALQPLTEARFAAARAVVEAALPEELRPVAIFALVTDKQTWHARVGGEPSQDEKELPARELATTASQGVVADVSDSPYFFVSVPVLWLNELPAKGPPSPPRVLATLVVGAPLVSENVVSHAASNSGVAALALLKGTTVVGTAGTDKALVELARTQLQPGSAEVIQRGEVLVLLDQLKLPMLVGVEDYFGGQAPLVVGMRRNLRNTPFEVISIASVRPFMRALADYQQNALLGLAGLAGLSVVWAFVMGMGLGERPRKAEAKGKGKASKGEPVAEPQSAPGPGIPQEESTAPVPTLAAEMPTVETPLAAITGRSMEEALPPEAGQPQAAPGAEPLDAAPVPPSSRFGKPAEDPFSNPPPGTDPFGGLSQAQELPYAPTAASSLPFDPPPAMPEAGTAAARRSAYEVQDQPTAAFSLQQAADPFAVAAAQTGAEDFSEATRVTQIPQELLQATQAPPPPITASPSQRTTAPTLSGIFPMPNTGAFAAPGATPPLGSQPTQSGSFNLAEEQHFQEIFREFLATRERCGEPNDGLTYEKFAAKLRKNKEQLIQKYSCRTVRFQVYVKEGKAALKATPVKE